MVVRRTINTLRERPKEDRRMIAGVTAIALVAALFFGWAYFFFKNIQSGQEALLSETEEATLRTADLSEAVTSYGDGWVAGRSDVATTSLRDFSQ